jgi:branched-chain amino acid transport system ATP-binding protein
MSLLEVRDLEVAYGPIVAVRGLSLSVEEGELVAVIGANGSGKTSTLRAISNLVPRVRGTVRFADVDVGRVAPHELARAGLLHLPEGRGTLGRLTVLENLRLAHDRVSRTGPYSTALERVCEVFPVLGGRLAQLAGSLSGGEQQMLALARAIIQPPKVLLVDEPSLGLSPKLVREVFALLRRIRASGTSIVVVEQNSRIALSEAQQACVLRQGSVVWTGRGANLADVDVVHELVFGLSRARPRA